MSSVIRRLLKRHPYLSNAAVFGSMFVGAEMSQQLFINKLMVQHSRERKPLDRAALGRYAVMGYAVVPSILYPWYKWLDRRFVGRALSVISKKIVLDVLLLGPVEVLVFFVCMNLMEGKRNFSPELRDKYVPTVLKEIYFWTPVQALNFAVVPASVRVAYVGVCSFAWLSLLCWIKRTPTSSISHTTIPDNCCDAVAVESATCSLTPQSQSQSSQSSAFPSCHQRLHHTDSSTVLLA